MTKWQDEHQQEPAVDHLQWVLAVTRVQKCDIEWHTHTQNTQNNLNWFRKINDSLFQITFTVWNEDISDWYKIGNQTFVNFDKQRQYFYFRQ